MNWKLILQLSLFGLAMSVATVFWISSGIEPLFWLVIFIVCAYIIAKRCTTKHFLTGFLVGLANCVWVTSMHIIFYQTYLAHHPQEAEMMLKMPMPDSPRVMMLLTGPIVGIVSGVILGLFAIIAGKLIKRSNVTA